MSTVDEAKLSWLKRLGVPDATITTLSANRRDGAPNRLNQPAQAAPAEPVGGNADSVPDLINEQGLAWGDTKKPDDTKKPGTDFPGGIPDKDEQDKRDNRNDSAAPRGKMLRVKNPWKKPKKQPPKGTALPLRIVLESSGIKAASPEPRTAVEIQGEIPFESNAKAADVEAILKSIQKQEIKVSIGSVPAKIELRLVERDQPPRLAIKIWIRTSIPPIERPGKDEIADAPVVVQIGDISSDGKATIKVHYKPSVSKDSKTPTPTGLEALDVLKRPLFPKGSAR